MENAARSDATPEIEDALSYLPRKSVILCRKGQRIFDEQFPSPGLHLVVRGRVKVTVALPDGAETLVDIFGTDDFFGESSIIGSVRLAERATALESSTLMSWPRQEIEDQAEKQPRLGIALLQMMVKRGQDYQARLECMALEKTSSRVVRTLLRFAARFGSATGDGATQIPPLTHQLISEYVGTSREIVTFQMNHLRQLGLLRYSRTAILIYTEPLKAHLATLS